MPANAYRKNGDACKQRRAEPEARFNEASCGANDSEAGFELHTYCGDDDDDNLMSSPRISAITCALSGHAPGAATRSNSEPDLALGATG